MKRIHILFFLFIINYSNAFCKPIEIQDELIGSWRGSMKAMRADDKETTVYLGVNIDKKEKSLSAHLNAYQINLDTIVTQLKVSNDQKINFEFMLRNKRVTFSGNYQDNTIRGHIKDDDYQREVVLHRVFRKISAERIQHLGGLYKFKNGRTILLSPAQWTLRYYNLEDGAFRTFFPESRTQFFAGTGYLEPTPIEYVINFNQENKLVFHDLKSNVKTIAERDESIEFEKIWVQNGNIKLSAMLFLPAQNEGLVPGVAIAAGSGRQNKYGSSGLPHHRAIWLALHGYATIIFDKRGVGDSEGNYDNRTQDLLASDVASMADYLASHPRVDSNNVGLLVHSQSGIYAPKTIAMSKNISFAAVISTTLVNGELQEIVRTKQQLEADGYSKEDIADAVTTQVLKFFYANHRIGWDAYVNAYNRVKDKEWFDNIIGSTIDPNRHSWDFWKDGNGFEPYKLWQKIDIPVLMLFGTSDPINPINKNLEVLKLSYAGDREKLLTIKIYENADHGLFMATEGGLFEESKVNQLTNYLEFVDRWIKKIIVEF